MSQIKQLLLLKKNGVSNRKAADIIGMNKETVNNYMNKVSADSLSLDELIRLDTLCPYCKAPLSPGSTFCGNCGKQVVSNDICSRCGAQLPPSAKFCPKCGNKR